MRYQQITNIPCSGTSKKINLEDMYSNLPRSLKTEVLVRTVEEDPEILSKRKALVESKRPAELAQFESIADFPLPEVLEGIFKPVPPKRRGSKDSEEKRK